MKLPLYSTAPHLVLKPRHMQAKTTARLKHFIKAKSPHN